MRQYIATIIATTMAKSNFLFHMYTCIRVLHTQACSARVCVHDLSFYSILKNDKFDRTVKFTFVINVAIECGKTDKHSCVVVWKWLMPSVRNMISTYKLYFIYLCGETEKDETTEIGERFRLKTKNKSQVILHRAAHKRRGVAYTFISRFNFLLFLYLSLCVCIMSAQHNKVAMLLITWMS